MGRSSGAISVINANLPGRVDLGSAWCLFNLICPLGDEERFLEGIRERLGDFMAPEKRALFLAEGAEYDTLDTVAGEEEVALFTVFLTVQSLNIERVLALNEVLVDLFGTEPDDPQSVIQELAAL